MIELNINLNASGWDEVESVAKTLELLAERIREEGDGVTVDMAEETFHEDTFSGIQKTTVFYSAFTS